MADQAFQRQQELKEEALALQASRAEEQIKRQQLAEEKWAAEQIEKKKRHKALVARINAQVLTTVQENDADELIKLLEGGADVNVENRLKRTPLYFAVMKDAVGLVRILLKYGAKVDQPDLYGQTPMSFAIKYKRHASFELLVHSQKGNLSVGGFLYQKTLEETVALHKQDMENKRIEQDRLDLLYKTSRKPKKLSLKEQYVTKAASPTNDVE